MRNSSRYRAALLPVVYVFLVSGAHAQTEPQRYVAIKGGANVERAEDNFGASSGAGSAAVGVRIAPNWSVEFEVWTPAFIRYGAPGFRQRHRDILANGAIIRRLDARRIRPFALFGVGVGRTQNRFTTCTALRPRFATGELVSTLVSCSEPDVMVRNEGRSDRTSFLFLVGAGTQIPLTRRITLVPELRMNLWITSVITRPSVGVQIAF